MQYYGEIVLFWALGMAEGAADVPKPLTQEGQMHGPTLDRADFPRTPAEFGV
jgi:hypothetical protein